MASYQQIILPDTMQTLVKNLGIGINEKYIQQLVVKSKQKHIIESTPNDAAKRFLSIEAFYSWYGTNHVVHWLLGEHDDLAGIIWYTVKKFPLETMPFDMNPSETFAVRLYEGYIGHHLSVPFMIISLKYAMKDKLLHDQKIPDMWLQTTPQNLAAIASYTKIGYKECFRDQNSVIMVIDAAKITSIIDNLD